MTISRSQMERQLRMGGGIMNIENRQKYLFGGITKSIKKAVKGVTNAAKKVVKSPLGKAAILGAVGFGIPGTSIGGLFGRGAAAPGMFNLFGPKGVGKYLHSPVQGSGSILGKIGLSGSAGKAALGIGAASTLAGILASDAEMTEEEAEELKQDPAALRNYLRLYYSNLNPNASKEEVDSFVRTNMYADGGRVNYQQGSQPAPAPAPAQPGSLQGATSLYGDVVEYLKRQGRNSDGPEPRMISPDEIIGKGPATPYPFSGAGSFLGGGAINTPTPPTGGNNVGITNLPRNKEKEERMLGLTTPAIKEVDPLLKEYYDNLYGLRTDYIKNTLEKGGTYDPGVEKLFRKGGGLQRQHMSEQELADEYNRLMKIRGGGESAELGLYVPTRKEYLLDQGYIKDASLSLEDPEAYKYKDFGDYSQKTGLGYQLEKKLRESPEKIDQTTLDIYNRFKARRGYAMGSPEQNAMQAAGIMDLPLNQNKAGVTELDLRESGGFIPPVGVKEKADDIPAMLSNNEFVFTADAVRGMGNGNVNKGAQRMYDMMKKLEKGGRV